MDETECKDLINSSIEIAKMRGGSKKAAIEEKITIETRDEGKAISETNEMLSREGRVVIAEAAFKFKNLFVRVDILVKEDNKISIYEVKAKSWDVEKDSFFDKKKSKITNRKRAGLCQRAFIFLWKYRMKRIYKALTIIA